MSALIESGNDAVTHAAETIHPTITPTTAETVALDGRVLGTVAGAGLGFGVRFEYAERDGVVQARYTGGMVRLGFRVGTRNGNHLAFRYAELATSGDSSSGRVDARIELLPDGRVRLRELWAIDSRRGEGASIVEELRPQVRQGLAG